MSRSSGVQEFWDYLSTPEGTQAPGPSPSEGGRSPFHEEASFPSWEGGALKQLLQLARSVPILEILRFLGMVAGGGLLLSRKTLSGQAHADTVLSCIPLTQDKRTQFPLLKKHTWTWAHSSLNYKCPSRERCSSPSFGYPRASP